MLLFLLFLLIPISTYAQSDHLGTVKTNQVLYFGTSPDYFPFSYYDADRKITGIDIKLAEEIARRIGVSLQAVDFSYEGLVDAVSHFQVDLIGGALPLNQIIQQKTDASQVYFDTRYGFLVTDAEAIPSNQIDFMSGDTIIGVRKGTSFEQYLNTKLIGRGLLPSECSRAYDSWQQLEQDLQSGIINMILLDEPTYRRMFKIGKNFLFEQPAWLSEQFIFASHRGSNLVNEVNRVLGDMIADGTARKIVDEFGSLQAPFAIKPNFLRPDDSFGYDAVSGAEPTCSNDMLLMGIASDPAGPERIRVYNTGSCVWNTSYFVRQVDGYPSAIKRLPVNTEIRPGFTYEFTVELSDAESTEQWTRWQMTAPNGRQFGQSIVLERTIDSVIEEMAQ